MGQTSAGADEVPKYLIPFDPIRTLSFLAAFKLACDTNGVHKRAVSWMIYLFFKRPTVTPATARIALKKSWHKCQKEGTVTSYCKAVNYLLKTYSKDDMVAETDPDIMQFAHQSSKSRTEYAEDL